MNEEWLTNDTARPAAEELLNRLRGAADRRPMETEHAEIARSLTAVANATKHLGTTPFTNSIGVTFSGDPEERETWYICGSKGVEGYFAGHQVVPWTHWLGRVATLLRNAIDAGTRRDSLSYGPSGRERELPVGPLVDYAISNWVVKDCSFYGAAVGTDVEERVAEQPDYGLKTIIQTLDLDQDDQIRGPMDGVFVLTGGPGVGKTTVALHRIPYLILEQNRSDSWELSPVTEDDPFFSADSTLVVVWKAHLVPYLRGCVAELVSDFPERNVKHIDKWVVETLRDYVKLGAGKESWRLEVGNPSIEQIKAHFSEKHISTFLDSDHSIRRASKQAFNEQLPKQISSPLTKRMEELLRLPRLPFALPAIDFSIAAFESARENLLKQLPDSKDSAQEFSEMQQEELREMRDAIQLAYRSALPYLSSYTDLLFDFYRSSIAQDVMSASGGIANVQAFLDAVNKQQESRVLSRSDTYLLIWLIQIITVGAESKAKSTRPLPVYSHIVIDEAQYYEPIVLRLFGELASLPDGVLTIVGDLEQRISADGGLLSWADTGFELDQERINRLVTNYRWTKEVFEFLSVFHRIAGITETLNPPLKWRIFGGRRPEIHTLPDFETELEFVAERVSQLRNDDDSSSWTTTVVVPSELIGSTREKLVELFESYFIESRWAEKEDVKESVDRVIVTDYDSIVGLEFDCVFAIGMNVRLANADRASIQSAWVALTRPKKFACVTRSGLDAIFDQQEFTAYHCRRIGTE